MDDRDELQDLWHSQPVSNGVPRFGLMEDLTAPVSYPMSRGVRWSNAVALLLMSINAWRDIRPDMGSFETAAAWAAFAACLGAAVVLMLPLGTAQAPPPDASVAEYRAAMAREFRRQSVVERRVYLPVFAAVWAAILIHATAQNVRGGFHWYHVTVPLLFATFFAWMMWYTRGVRNRAVRRILSGL